MTFCCLTEEERGSPVLRNLSIEHVKGLAECEIAHDVEAKVRAPRRDLTRLSPFLRCAASEFLDVGRNVCENEILDAFDRGLGESVAHDAALAGMSVSI